MISRCTRLHHATTTDKDRKQRMIEDMIANSERDGYAVNVVVLNKSYDRHEKARRLRQKSRRVKT